MSVEQDSSFFRLPPEVVFYIFRHLDAQTIVRSVRLVCKQFSTFVNTYDQFNLHLNSISKPEFHYLCNLIRPNQVKSLTLSNDAETPGQIEYFLSCFRLKQYTQLRSLTLLEIDQCYLHVILKDVLNMRLEKLIIISKEDLSTDDAIANDLSMVTSLPTLWKFCLDVMTLDASRITLSPLSMIQHLEIHCQSVSAYCEILHRLPHLQILVVEQLLAINSINSIPDLKPACQLSSLTFKYSSINMNTLQALLLLTPTLNHLYLLRCVNLHDFILHISEWQLLVESTLSLLIKFEFFLVETGQLFFPSVEHVIAPFQTPFWTEVKRWYAICDYTTHPLSLIVHSPSAHDPKFEYIFYSKHISRSTSTPIISNVPIMNHIRILRLDLSTGIPAGLPYTSVFPNIEWLILQLPDIWPPGSLRSLSTLINLPSVTKLTLEMTGSSEHPLKMLHYDVALLLKLAHNVRCLYLLGTGNSRCLSNYDLDVCSEIPENVKHLTVSISMAYQMNLVVEKLKYRSSINFLCTQSYHPVEEIYLKWFKDDNGSYSYRLTGTSLSVWFDKMKPTTKHSVY
ncbi:unnamed protein product [Adineta ricciae]|uniref:F-box domain-containing protein n=1 Tax=Adineta ricciae TaxID=249248 RepID=A0A814XI97_ADIRI|nr:unnamed protein product [Adineta ricciae]